MDMPSTIKAVQRKIGVTPDGVAGPLTWAAIAREVGVKEDEVNFPFQSEWAKKAFESYRERMKTDQ